MKRPSLLLIYDNLETMPAALYRMKKDTLGLEDQADAAALRERFNLKDEDR